ncbi:unnamed protein product, partial [marine sediment metagenome]
AGGREFNSRRPRLFIIDHDEKRHGVIAYDAESQVT